MNRLSVHWIVAALVAGLLVGLATSGGAVCQAADRMLAHDVYFTLKDKSPQAKEKLVVACKKYLSGHPGTVWFAAGPLAEEFEREVNDRGFDVALHVVFVDKAAHDQYQTSERHLKFIAENKDSFEKVRVFDSYLDVTDHGATAPAAESPKPAEPKPEEPKPAGRVSLPDAAAGFAGMIQGEVVKKGQGEFLLRVERVTQVWRHSKAKEPNSLVGKLIAVEGSREGLIGRFIASLKVGEQVTLDVAHKGPGQSLTIVELTAEQRGRGEK